MSPLLCRTSGGMGAAEGGCLANAAEKNGRERNGLPFLLRSVRIVLSNENMSALA